MVSGSGLARVRRRLSCECRHARVKSNFSTARSHRIAATMCVPRKAQRPWQGRHSPPERKGNGEEEETQHRMVPLGGCTHLVLCRPPSVLLTRGRGFSLACAPAEGRATVVHTAVLRPGARAAPGTGYVVGDKSVRIKNGRYVCANESSAPCHAARI